MNSSKITEILNNGKVSVSCELFPPKKGTELHDALAIVERIVQIRPSYMSVTYGAGGTSAGHTVAVAEHIGRLGVPALAHLTCVKADEKQLFDVLTYLRNSGVGNVLALRGDVPADARGETKGCFEHASQLIRFIKGNGDFCVGGAAYPEGHPEAGSLEADIKNTKFKIEAGVDFLVTQMFFDNSVLYNYMFRLLSAGISVPVVPGIMPVTNAGQIRRICELSGTKLPPQFRSMVEKFADKPAALQQAGIAYATGQIIDLIANGFENIHVYTMNKPEIIGGIMENLSEIVA